MGDEDVEKHAGTPPAEDIQTAPSSRSSSSEASRHSDQHADQQHGQQPDLEAARTLSRASSGPPFSAFSHKMIVWIVAMNCLSAFVSPATANIYFPALPTISASLGVTTSMANLSLTTYMIFQALSPTFFGDLGDAAGRRPAFIIAFTIFMGANIGLALQRNYAALLVLRCLQSTGSSGGIALSYAVVADIVPSSERGKYMGIVGAGITVGPALGPIIGGLLTQYLGWPSIFWFLVIVTAVWMVPYVLTVPETCRNVVGNGSIPPQGWNMSLLEYRRFRRLPKDPSARPKTKIPLPNPFNTLKVLLYKDMAMILAYNALLYVGFMTLTATMSTQFEAIYGYDEVVLGLCYLPIGLGCAISSVAQGLALDWNYRRTAAKLGMKIDRKRGDDLRHFPIERVRIQVVVPMVALGTLVYVGYAWALDYEAHVAVPLVLTFFIGLTVTGAFSVVSTLIVDLFPASPATATGANNFCRCLAGAVSTAVIDYVIAAIGRGWAFTLLAAVFALPSPALWVIQRNGPRWREERRLKMESRSRGEGTS